MKLRTNIFLLALSLLFFFNFKENLFAVTDIMLVENNENTVDLIVNSDVNVFIPAIDIKIHYSNNLEIEDDDVAIVGDMCQISENIYIKDNIISIECFNEEDTSASGTFATIHYTNDNDSDYYFYIDEKSLDIGNLEYTITDINKPNNISDKDNSIKTVNTNTEENKDFLNRVKHFLIENQLYTLLIVAGIIGLATLIIALFPERRRTN